jgi:hypothetical protein
VRLEAQYLWNLISQIEELFPEYIHLSITEKSKKIGFEDIYIQLFKENGLYGASIHTILDGSCYCVGVSYYSNGSFPIDWVRQGFWIQKVEHLLKRLESDIRYVI